MLLGNYVAGNMLRQMAVDRLSCRRVHVKASLLTLSFTGTLLEVKVMPKILQ